MTENSAQKRLIRFRYPLLENRIVLYVGLKIFFIVTHSDAVQFVLFTIFFVLKTSVWTEIHAFDVNCFN